MVAPPMRGGNTQLRGEQAVLLHDGMLRLFFAPAAGKAVERWLPRGSLRAAPAAPPGSASIRVRLHRPHAWPRAAVPSLRLDSVDAWVDDETGRVRMRGQGAGCSGLIDLSRRAAGLRLPDDAEGSARAGVDLYSLLTLSSAMLLGRLRRALVHAAAAVDPAGGAWLLVGDTHAGKSTTCANLVRAGWRYLSDDQVVLFTHVSTGEVWVEGWPRTFQLDEGWQAGTPTGRRSGTDIDLLHPGALRRTARLAGVLFPSVEPASRTEPLPLSPATALALLVRQSPWLMADRGAAPRVLALLQRTVARPVARLRLGLDSYADPALLHTRLAPLLAGT
jgi:hypothetical protein